MADIFISYSSRDRAQADQLTELLTSAGLSVWIDKQGIDVATSWSGEIVDAIEGCHAFMVLLSEHSIQSVNVIKEVSLAAEKKKKLLPLDLEPVVLPRDLQYHLAGIQRSPMTNIDSIIRALGKLGLEATSAPSLKLVKETDPRKSLMILPFEDLSPTADNQWFADGIVSEMISSLSNVKALRLTDAQTTKEFKNYKGHLTVYAKEMGIRYFMQGDVRKFGDSIKITSRLLDIETGDHLWQDSIKGTMENIFEMQEAVATKVVEGLNVILTADEAKKLGERLTTNPEAYELYMKGLEYYRRHVRADRERSLELLEAAILLDPKFAAAHLDIAGGSLDYYKVYSREVKWIERGKAHITLAESILGKSAPIYRMRAELAQTLGEYEEALRFAENAIKLEPRLALAYDSLGQAYTSLGRPAEAAAAFERYAQLRENDRDAQFTYLIALHEAGDADRLLKVARDVYPNYERHIRLTPDDLNARVTYCTILGLAGEHERSLAEARKLDGAAGMDAFALYNLACVFLHERETESGFATLLRSVEQGFRNVEIFYRDPDLDQLRGMLEFEALVKELEATIAAENLAGENLTGENNG